MITETYTRIEALHQLGRQLLETPSTQLAVAIQRAGIVNPWFEPEQVQFCLHQIATTFLDAEKLYQWAAQYPIEAQKPKRIGMVPAGNLPLVGFHDMLCCFVAGHTSIIKMSDKDNVLLPAILQELFIIEPNARPYFEMVDQLKNFDAIIATGSNNTARYFDAYFSKYPNIIRGQRNGVAVLNGSENTQQLNALAQDIYRYFGLGCRSVSHLKIPQGYDLIQLCDVLSAHTYVSQNNRWQNNYEYNQALLLLNLREHLALGNLVLVQDDALPSRIATLHYSYYPDLASLQTDLEDQREQIQCIATDMTLSSNLPIVPLGQTQVPTLSDYPDGMDVMAFLCNL